MFFVETKKPSVNIREDREAAYQLRRYAWSAGLRLSILTNFEEFAVYESRQKPHINDSSATERVLLLTYNDYVDKLEDIASVFSRTAILQGSFDRYFESTKGKKGTLEVDTAFLVEMEGWRDSLARNLALRNPALNVRGLNYTVQATIDRIIFLRMCEDRGIEPYKQLASVIQNNDIYKKLFEIYVRADEKYNSGLFHFQKEKGRTTFPDEISFKLTVDDKVLKEIIKNLYYPESPYEFSVLKPEILGNVYERFLGKIIRLTQGHRAIIEERPEVKKAGGVFYTPQYIVDYMVENTVGKLCLNKKPNQISNIHILDPACGSGSFLLGAYSYLLNFHLDYYSRNSPEKWKEEVYRGADGQWLLTTREKKRILLNNIFGVDKDSQAVEVTKLSLLLKVLEGERKDILERQQKLFSEKALPDLGNNIKCGNSLIGPDYYANGIQTTLFDNEESFRINAFDWKYEFAEVMASGGFNIVIGNPPYVDIKTLPEDEVSYIFDKYRTANNRINLFAAFIEKSLSIIDSKSFAFSMIVPTSLMPQTSYKELRKLITDEYQIQSIVRLPNESFGSSAGEVKVDTAIVVLSNRGRGQKKIEIIGYSGYDRITKINPENAQVHRHITKKELVVGEDQVWSFNTSSLDESILDRCVRDSSPLVDCADFSLGLTPYDRYKGHTKEQIENRVFHATTKKDQTYRKLLAGNDVERYLVTWGGKEWISYGSWLGAPREQRFFTHKRILIKQIIDWSSKRIWAALTEEELYNTQNAFNLIAKDGWEPEYLLGILNSKLMSYYHKKKFLDEYKMRFQKILIKDCKKFPIHICDKGDKQEIEMQNKIIDLVKRISELKKKRTAMLENNEIVSIERIINTLDSEIDKCVYILYGLTNDEIDTVEKALVDIHK
jgi:type I restriction-modification system DNA methylase subunit